MQEHSRSFSLRARVQSFRYAWNGLLILVRSHLNAWIHAMGTVAVVMVGVGFKLRAMEVLNAAIELIADKVTLEQCSRIGKAKDVADYEVLAAAITSVLISLLVFLSHLVTPISW